MCGYLSDNIALGRPVQQKENSYSPMGFAVNAVDGDLNGDWNGGSCMATRSGGGFPDDPWWWVDLGQDYNIGRVDIINRGDCCGE